MPTLLQHFRTFAWTFCRHSADILELIIMAMHMDWKAELTFSHQTNVIRGIVLVLAIDLAALAEENGNNANQWQNDDEHKANRSCLQAIARASKLNYVHLFFDKFLKTISSSQIYCNFKTNFLCFSWFSSAFSYSFTHIFIFILLGPFYHCCLVLQIVFIITTNSTYFPSLFPL